MSQKKIIRLSPNPQGFGETPDELTQDMFESALPVQNSHEYYSDDDIGLYVGVWDTNDMVETAGPYPCDEYMWLLEGKADIKNNKTGELEKVRAGEAFIIPKGYDCQWHQSGYLRKYFFISEHPDETIPNKPSVEGIIIPDVDAPAQSSAVSEPFLVSANDGSNMINQYQDTTGKFFSGIWECAPFQSESRQFPYHFFAYVMEGSISLTDEKKVQHVFHAGDAFFIPDGVLCTGQSSSKVRLNYAILFATKN